MSARVHNGREHQLVSLEKRIRELDERSAEAAAGLIVAATRERRTTFGADLERERALDEGVAPEAEADWHLKAIEHQLREVLAERDSWFRNQLDGRRRRRDDFRLLQRLKEEHERLTAELMRCATLLARDRDAAESPRLRRVWQMLRLSGT